MEHLLKQAQQKKTAHRPIAIQMGHRLREGLLIIAAAFAVFLLVSFVTYHSADPAWSSTGGGRPILNWGGRAGAFLTDIFLSLFGCVAYIFPPMIVFAAWIGVRTPRDSQPFKLSEFIFKTVGFILIFICSCGITALYLRQSVINLPAYAGGILGDIAANALTHFFNITGSALLLVTGFLCGVTLFIGLSWVGLIDAMGWQVLKGFNFLLSFTRKKITNLSQVALEPQFENRFETSVKKSSTPPNLKPKVREPTLIEPVIKKPSPPNRLVKEHLTSVTAIAPGSLPPVTLLDLLQPANEKAFSNVSFEELSLLVEQRLADFGVESKVVAVHPGPVITRFELDLAPGIKVSKISGLAKDIARSLSVNSVRVVEVIPGKSVIGLELPNEHRDIVGLREILESVRYAQSRSPVSLALGKDIAGFPVVVDLAKMPHLLVAGTTGSGKSVSLNAMLLSMLFKALPEQLRFIMIDPKMLELSVYEGIPHLLTPVITDMKDAANALRWCVAEMDRRYKLMASLGVRNLAGYNLKIAESIKEKRPIPTPDWLIAAGHTAVELQSLPTIVVIVDELADMMMVVGKKVEDLVARIAQKARAAGIHLILATQRPSVDVITGLIKANVPTRIAFQVSSRIDSRTILDQQGAEQLLGNGDMLYLPPGTGVPVRVHGAFVGDEEVHRVVAAWQTYGKPTYLDGITETQEDASGNEESTGEADPLYDEALRIVTESRRASISLVQRRLRIGYNRAARIMEDMERVGVVSTMDSNGSREVLAPPPVE